MADVHNVFEGIFEPLEGVDLVFFAGSQQGINHGSSLGGLVTARKEVILPTESHRADGIFHRIVVNL